MNRESLKQYLQNQYAILPDSPWPDTPEAEVYRHPSNRKWFALVLHVSKRRLGLKDDTYVDIVNLKCDPILIDLMRGEAGIYPAYHMNKQHWITVPLDGSLADEKLYRLIEVSFSATAPKPGKNALPGTRNPKEF